jgi:hypothetical protein
LNRKEEKQHEREERERYVCVRVFMCVNVLLNAADDLTNRSRTEKEDRQKRGRKRKHT